MHFPMMTSVILWIVLLHWSCTAIAHGNLDVGLSNKAVIAGQRMELACRVSGNESVFKWNLAGKQIFRNKSNGDITVSTDHYSYDIANKNLEYIFTNSTNTTDAGIYNCSVNPGQHSFSAHLIVFEEEPLCLVNHMQSDKQLTFTIGDQISITCKANFNGSWIPSVEWRQHTLNATYGEQDEVLTIGVSTTSSSNNITSTIDLIIDFDEPTYFSFKILFLRYPGLANVSATNSPDLPFEWKSPEVNAVKSVIVKTIRDTVTAAFKETGHWNLNSIGFLALILLSVIVIVGFLFRRCYIVKRRKDGSVECPLTTNPIEERPASGEYDVIPMDTPDIYDRIQDGDVNETVSFPDIQHQQPHLPLIQCYSGLSEETRSPFDSYDALSLYLPMESTMNGVENASQDERCQNLYTNEPRGSKQNADKRDYLVLVEENADPVNRASPTEDAPATDVFGYVPPGTLGSGLADTNGDYLMPFL